jgi:hypothetical protein
MKEVKRNYSAIPIACSLARSAPPAMPQAVSGTLPSPTYPAGSLQLALFQHLNQARNQCGFPALQENTILDQAAEAHQKYQVANSTGADTEVAGKTVFKRCRFPVEIILVCMHWYCKYGISNRDLAEMMQERGAEVEPSTIMRWVHRYALELERRVRWYQGYRVTSWRVDETYVKVGGKWKYLFRAVDKHGRLIDFILTDRRNTRAAYRFLGKALTTMRHWLPSSITQSLTEPLRA